MAMRMNPQTGQMQYVPDDQAQGYGQQGGSQFAQPGFQPYDLQNYDAASAMNPAGDPNLKNLNFAQSLTTLGTAQNPYWQQGVQDNSAVYGTKAWQNVQNQNAAAFNAWDPTTGYGGTHAHTNGPGGHNGSYAGPQVHPGSPSGGVVQNSVGTWGQPLQDTRSAVFNAMSDPTAKGLFTGNNQGTSTANDFQSIIDSGNFGGMPIADLMSKYGAGSAGAAGAQSRAGQMPQFDPATGGVTNVPTGGNLQPPNYAQPGTGSTSPYANSGIDIPGNQNPYGTAIPGGDAGQLAQLNAAQNGMQPQGGYSTMPDPVGANAAAQYAQYGAPQPPMQNPAFMKSLPSLGSLGRGRTGGFFSRRMY